MTKIPKLIPLTKEAQVKHDEFIKRCMESLNSMTNDIPEEARLTDEELFKLKKKWTTKDAYDITRIEVLNLVKSVANAQLEKAIPIIQEDERKRLGEWLEKTIPAIQENYPLKALSEVIRVLVDASEALKEGRDPSKKEVNDELKRMGES